LKFSNKGTDEGLDDFVVFGRKGVDPQDLPIVNALSGNYDIWCPACGRKRKLAGEKGSGSGKKIKSTSASLIGLLLTQAFLIDIK
jgi:hypothetical protein